MQHPSLSLLTVSSLFALAPLLAPAPADVPSAPLAGDAQDPVDPTPQDARGKLVAASVLHDAQLYAAIELERNGDAAEALANIDRLTFVAETGRLLDAVVASGGMAGIDPELRVLECASLKWVHASGHFVTDLTRAEFSGLPVLGEGADEGLEARRAAPPDATSGVRAPTEPIVMASLNDEPVRAGAGDTKWGSIAGLEVDWQARRVAYAIVAVGGVAGRGATSHPVPWSALDVEEVVDERQRARRVSVPKTVAELAGAPALDAENGRVLSSPKFRRELAVFWGTEPTATEGAAATSGTRPGGR